MSMVHRVGEAGAPFKGHRFWLGLVGLAFVFFAGLPERAKAEGDAPECPSMRIVDPAGGSELSLDALRARADAARAVFVGERHGIGAHVALGTCLFTPEMALAMEHFPRGRGVDGAVPQDSSSLFDTAEWEALGWPDRSIYLPLIERAVDLSAPVYGVDRPRRGDMTVEESDALLARAPDFGAQTEAVLADWVPEMIDNHCGLIDAQIAGHIARVQVEKDRFMALGILDALEAAPRVLYYAGKGHIRADRGVGALVRAARPDLPVLVIAAYTREEYEALVDPQALAARYDLVVIAGEMPEAERDACAGLREEMQGGQRREGQ
ncbi:MAG: ChaN family lipoprotein [Hyphomicrobiaceae bacterium]|nr:ChaN family lipoprotein [Hyphomicrobiaceae bacterium]